MTLATTKATVAAIKKETTEGTIVLPASGTDFIPIQDDFEIVPNIENLENAEIRASIGKAKSIQGLEAPEASFSLYMKHSGVEGQAPSYGELFEAVWGSTSTQSTQRTTTSSSTVSLIKLASGGSDYSRGKAVLLKDGTNGYAIRPIHSVSSNDLTPAFNLSAAPASGVSCGKFVNYSPANSGHPSISVWKYNGNAHSVEAMAGGKVVEMSMEASAGELINSSFSMVGTKYFFNPIEITSSTEVLDFLDDATTRAASVAVKVYKTPHELADAIAAAMNGLGSSNTFTCTYSNTTGKFTITSSGTTLTLKWNTGTNTASSIASKIGFSTAADSSSALTYTSTDAQVYSAGYTVSYDNVDPLVAKANEVLLGTSTDTTNFCANTISFTFSNENSQVLCVSSETGLEANFFQGREITVAISGKLDQYDANLINKYLNNTEVRFCYNFGEKSGGNWVAGKCASIYMPTCSVSSFQVTDLDGVVGVDIELKGFVDSSGNGEIYLNFL